MASILLPIQCWKGSSLIQSEGEAVWAGDSASPGRTERVKRWGRVQWRENVAHKTVSLVWDRTTFTAQLPAEPVQSQKHTTVSAISAEIQSPTTHSSNSVFIPHCHWVWWTDKQKWSFLGINPCLGFTPSRGLCFVCSFCCRRQMINKQLQAVQLLCRFLLFWLGIRCRARPALTGLSRYREHDSLILRGHDVCQHVFSLNRRQQTTFKLRQILELPDRPCV